MYLSFLFRTSCSAFGALLAAQLAAPGAARATVIAFCPADITVNEQDLHNAYFDAAGGRFTIVVARGPIEGCQSMDVDWDAGNAVWIEAVSSRTARQLESGVVLHAKKGVSNFLVTDISPLREQPPPESPRHLPVETNLIDNSVGRRAFGIEERVSSAIENGKLQVKCGAGSKPAGVLLELMKSEMPFLVPLQWRVDYRADHTFHMGFANHKQWRTESPFWMLELPVQEDFIAKTIDIPATLFVDDRRAILSIVCPAQESVIDVSHIGLVARAKHRAIPPRSFWIWEPRRWIASSEPILRKAAELAAKRVFISVVLDEVNGRLLYANELRRFIADAHAQGVQVWAVEGDPYAVLPRERDRFARRARIISDFFIETAPVAKIDGLQYDIEPYLIPGYRLDEPHWLNAYLETLKAIKAATSMEVEAVVPYWWLFSPYQSKSVLYAVMEIVDRINIMLYRTNADDLQRLAQPILAVGASMGKPVGIALELGHIDDENVFVYLPAPVGTLWVAQQGDYTVLVGLREAVAARRGQIFALRNQRVADGGRISFHATPQRLWSLVPGLEKVWSLWPSFGGIAIHGN